MHGSASGNGPPSPQERDPRERSTADRRTMDGELRTMTGRPDVDVSVVIPCLNEEASIGACVTEAGAAIRRAGMRGEVVVVDNGSEDRSAELAEAAGARVVREPERGYGRAYLTGIGSSRGDVIFMGDADTTYDFGALPRFLARID